jgi:predicted regulator of Ras-like GTPase activity (Roadblock/LC7/MglB family)
MTDQEDHAFIKLRSGLSILAPQMAAIEKELAGLLEAVPAKMILLVDTSGQLVSAAGDVREIDTTGLGSLIAGDLAASQMIARMTGEFQEFQMILREGERSHMIISEAGHHLTFLVQFSKDVPLGWARKLIQRQATILKDLADQPGQETEESAVEFMSGGDLPDMFSGALDDIWKG